MLHSDMEKQKCIDLLNLLGYKKNNAMTKVPSIPDSKTMQCFSCRTSNKSFFQLWLSAVKIRVIELYQENLRVPPTASNHLRYGARQQLRPSWVTDHGQSTSDSCIDAQLLLTGTYWNILFFHLLDIQTEPCRYQPTEAGISIRQPPKNGNIWTIGCRLQTAVYTLGLN